MRYGITSLAAGSEFFIEISSEVFEHVKRAKKSSLVFLGIEEKLEILLENYVEYEKDLLELTLRNSLSFDRGRHSFRDDIHIIVRRLVNLLSAARLYIDQVKCDLSGIYGKGSKQHLDLKQALSREYDKRFGYRVMEALRNFVQHRGLPLHSLTYASNWEKWENGGPERRLRFRIEPSLNVDELLEDPDFKKKIKAELELAARPINVTSLVRDYVEGIGCAHEELRKRTEQDVQGLEGITAGIVEMFSESIGRDVVALGVVAQDEESELYKESLYLSNSNELRERRRLLVRKNSVLGSLSRRYVSGVIEDAARKNSPKAT